MARVRPSFALLLPEGRDRPAQRRTFELSVGMSADFEDAIEEGANVVRVG